MEIFLLILGLVIVSWTYLDFFYTTLSGNGFGSIARRVNDLISRAILSNRNKFIFDNSGPIHLLVTAFVWLVLIFLGVYTVFMSSDEMVVHSQTKAPADAVEVFYFTCYTLSTLGIGDYVPGSDLSRILTGILSFSGFIFLTICLTYLLSVITASLERKELALYISTMGENIEELYEFAILDDKLTAVTENGSDIKQLILKNASSRVFFPITQHFLAWKRIHSAEVQLASLYEVLNIGRKDLKKDSTEYAKIEGLLKAVEYYLELGLENPARYDHDSGKLKNLRGFWKRYKYQYDANPNIDEAIDASLKSAGWSWQEVYKTGAKREKL